MDEFLVVGKYVYTNNLKGIEDITTHYILKCVWESLNFKNHPFRGITAFKCHFTDGDPEA